MSTIRPFPIIPRESDEDRDDRRRRFWTAEIVPHDKMNVDEKIWLNLGESRDQASSQAAPFERLPFPENRKIIIKDWITKYKDLERFHLFEKDMILLDIQVRMSDPNTGLHMTADRVSAYPGKLSPEMTTIIKDFFKLLGLWVADAFKKREYLYISVGVIRNSFRAMIRELAKQWDAEHSCDNPVVSFKDLMGPAYEDVPTNATGETKILLDLWVDMFDKLMAFLNFHHHYHLRERLGL